MSDDDWVSDAGSVEQDRFNQSNFNVVKGMTQDEYSAPVRSTPKPGFIPNSFAAHVEKEAANEAKEREQAKSFKAQSPAKKSSPPSERAPSTNASSNFRSNSFNAERKPSAIKTSFSGRKPSFNGERKPSFNAERKPSFNAQRKPSYSNAGRKASVNIVGAAKFEGHNYDQEVIDFFSKMNEKSITEQAVEYLNAYWDEVGDQAEFIFSVAHRIFREADMHRQGITLYYKYEEGSNVDYPTYLYFYEKLCKFVATNPEWRQGKYEKSAVYDVKTAIAHKRDLQEKVDVNFDGRISFLEFLLYQYNVFSNPAQFMERSRMAGEEHPEIIAARLALEKVNQQIKEYEMERARLEEGAKENGVKGLTFKHQLTMLDVSPIAEKLNEALIKAEAAVRIAVRRFQGSTVLAAGAGTFQPRGALWWMQRDLQEKKARTKQLKDM